MTIKITPYTGFTWISKNRVQIASEITIQPLKPQTPHLNLLLSGLLGRMGMTQLSASSITNFHRLNIDIYLLVVLRVEVTVEI